MLPGSSVLFYLSLSPVAFEVAILPYFWKQFSPLASEISHSLDFVPILLGTLYNTVILVIFPFDLLNKEILC